MELLRLLDILDNKRLTDKSKILLEVVPEVLGDDDFEYSELDGLYITGFKYDGEDFILKLDDDDNKIATVKALKEYINKNKQLKEDLEDNLNIIEIKCLKDDPYNFVENNCLFARIENGRYSTSDNKVLYREEDYHLIIKAVE